MSALPRGWTSAPIDDLGELRLGKMLDKAKNQGQPAKYLRNINVRWFRFDLEDMHTIFVLPAELKQLSVEDGDLFVCEGGEPGRCAVWRGGDNGFVYQKALHRFRSQGGMVPELLMYRLRHDADTGVLAGAFTGTTIKHLTRESLARFKIPIPPLPEQKRIADKLDALLARVDACRERLDRVPTLLKRFRQSVLAAATSGELTREWREARGLELDGWTNSTVGQVIEGIEAGLNVQCEERPPAHSERGLVKISAVTWGTYDDNESKTLPRSAEVPERSRIRTGDFLISRANTLDLVGACVVVHQVTRPVFLSDKVLRLVMPGAWKPWLLLVLQSPAGRHEIEDRARGNQLSMRNLSQVDLRELCIPIPSPDERDEIVRRVGLLLGFAGEIERRCRVGRAIVGRLAQSSLAKAFRGELVPQDPDDEPAAELLARIRSRAAASGTPGKLKRAQASTR